MENKLLALPPHKRFRLMHPENPTVNSCLPAKKRKESRDPPPFPTNLEIAAAATSYPLPAKKRITALHPNLLPHKPISPFDLNLEYNPKSDEEETHIPEIDETRVEEETEDGILCAVCQSTDGDPSDPIVFCDGCDLTVHATCYGDPLTKGVPSGDWFCSRCQLSDQPDGPSCCLCPINGGALKPTKNGLWAHIVCAVFIPEVFFCDPEGREGIDCSKVPGRRWGKKCYVCKKSNGCAIDCSEEKCGLCFHVTCGVNEDLYIEYKEGRKKGAIIAGFCKTHTDLWMKVMKLERMLLFSAKNV